MSDVAIRPSVLVMKGWVIRIDVLVFSIAVPSRDGRASQATRLNGHFSLEYFHRFAGHVDVAVVGPVEFEIAAGEVGENLAAVAAGQGAGDADGAGTGAASERDAAAPFPGAHRHFAGAVDLHEVDVDSSWED